MENLREPKQIVTSLFHVGAVVSDLAESIRVFEDSFGFKKVSQRSVDHDYIGQLIGVPGISAEIAMLDIGDGIFLELIVWHGSVKHSLSELKSDLSSRSIQHLCIYVDDADFWYAKLSSEPAIKIVCKNPLTIPIGPNMGSKVFFVLVLDEIYVEIFERIKK